MMTADDRGKFRRKCLIIIRKPLLYPPELRAQVPDINTCRPTCGPANVHQQPDLVTAATAKRLLASRKPLRTKAVYFPATDLRLTSAVAFGEPSFAETHLATHDVEHEYPRFVAAVKNAARRLYDLAVARLPQLWRPGTALGMPRKLSDVLKHPRDKPARRLRIIKSDVIGNGVKVLDGRFGPDYFNHRAIRLLASA